MNSCTPGTVWSESGFKYPAILAAFVRVLPTYPVHPDQFSTPEADLPNSTDPLVKGCLWLPRLLLSHCSIPASNTVQQYVSDILESAKHGSMPQPPVGETEGHVLYVSTLRRALMLLKVIDFLASIKYKAAGLHNAEDILWHLLSVIWFSCQPVETYESHLLETYAQEKLILSLLVEMLIFQASELILLKPKQQHAIMALRIMQSLMTKLQAPSKMLQQVTQSTRTSVSHCDSPTSTSRCIVQQGSLLNLCGWWPIHTPCATACTLDVNCASHILAVVAGQAHWASALQATQSCTTDGRFAKAACSMCACQ